MEEKEINIKLKKSDLWKIGTAIFAVLFLISIFGGFNGSSDNKKDVAPTPNNGVTETVKVQINDDDPVLGDKNADISIVEFSDFECPFCARAASGALADFKNSDYFKDGDVNLIYKQFPLTSIHQNAQKAAEASECANKQGKFWEYHDTLFANQRALDINSLKAYASNLNLNMDDFNSCLDSDEFAASVANDVKQGMSAGARGTPYFVIVNNDNGNSQVVSGAVPWANFEAAINSL
jgi:protein-disulfide isomerase